MTGISFGVERPEFLWLLLALVPVVWLAVTTRRKVPRRRLIAATTLRALAVIALVLALAGLTRKEPVDALGVVYAIDASASVGTEGQRRALAFVQASLKEQGRDDVAGVVTFGGDALVEAQPRADLVVEGLESTPVPHQSDLAAGLRLASALLPGDRSRRIVLLSDGEQTRGDAASQVLLTAGGDLEVGVVPLGSVRGPEVWLDDLLMPPHVDEGAGYDVRVVARTDVAAEGHLRLYRNDEYLGDLPVSLEPGRAEVFTFRQEATVSGLYRYRAALDVDSSGADTMPQNNEVVGTIQVTGRPRVLYAEGYPDQARYLADALRREGLSVDVVRPDQIPSGPSELRGYAAVILSDVPAYQLSRRQQETLQSYVRDMGRGLVMIGGDRSFGVGGYHRSPVEEALPVRMDIEDKTRFPKLGMVIAMDKSCSMGGGAGSKLGMAKEAGIQTAELLSDRDLLGVIGFDHAASWIVPLTPMTNRDEVVDTISSIRTGGGTDIYPALDRSVRGLEATDASLKHVILLSDGMTAPGDFKGLITDARARDITVSAVAIGSDADRATMKEFADWGGGHYYLVTDIQSIPAIFTRETMLASRSFLVEEPFRVKRDMPSELLRGIDESQIPVLGGYVATEAKPRAVVALTTVEEHPMPILAHWRYGLGRSVAYTSDAKSRWAGKWVGTDSYTRFWTQTIRWAVGSELDGSVDTTAEIREGELVVTVDAFAPDGTFRNFLEGEARIVAPDLTVRPVTLRQIAPGRYQGVTRVDQDGSWLVGVALKQGDEVVGQAVAEAVQPYSPEYRPHGGGGALLAELGRLGGGGVLDDPAKVFARPEVARSVPHPVWPGLLALVAFLLLADVAARRLALGGRAPGLAPAAVTAGVRAKQPLRRRRRPPRPAVARAASAQADPEPIEEEPETPLPEAPVVDPESYAGRLLAARQAARKRMGDDE